MKIGAINFQSLQKVSLEFAGFTVITGKSNLGKSALVRALTAIIYGTLGDYFVRRGTDFCKVGVRFDDGLTLKWQKVPTDKKTVKRETELEINDVRHTKLGKDLYALTGPLGFLQIRTAGGDFRPQIAGQFDKAFLLDANDSVVAEVFKALGRGDVIATAKDYAKRDVNKARGELKIRAVDLEAAQTDLEKFQWVPGLVGEAKSLEVAVADQEKSGAVLEELDLLGEALPDPLPGIPFIPLLDTPIQLCELMDQYQEFVIPEVPVPPEWNVLWPVPDIDSYLQQQLEISEALEARIPHELNEALAELERLEKELGVCPTCGEAFKTHEVQH